MEKLPDEIPLSVPSLHDFLNKAKPVDAPVSDTTDRVRIPKKQSNTKAISTDCENVNGSHGKSLVASPHEIKNLDKPRQWEVANSSNQTLAIVVSQDGKKVAVAFVAPLQKYSASIPSSTLDFVVKHSRDKCINWRQAGGVLFTSPAGSNGSTDFVTNVSDSPSGIDVKTRTR